MNLMKHDNVHTDLQGKRRIRNLEDEYAKLWQMYGDIEAERDRLREAYEVLKELQEYAGYWSEYDAPIAICYRIDNVIAAVEALQDDGE